MSLGYNLSNHDDFVGQDCYGNKMLASRPKGSFQAPWEGHPAGPTDFGSVVWTEASKPAGNYKVVATKVTDNWKFQLRATNGIVQKETVNGGMITIPVTINDPEQFMFGAYGLKDLALYHESFTGGLFNPDFISLLAGARILRFMEFQQINRVPDQPNKGNTKSWADRSVWNGETYADRGAPLEDCIELCKTVNCDGWINIPDQVGLDKTKLSEYVGNLCSLLLRTDKNFVLEFSNEISWNSIFAQYKTNFDAAQVEHVNDSTNPWYRGYIRVAEKTRQMYDAVKAAGATDRVKVILPTQLANPNVLKVMTTYLVSKYGGIKEWCYGAAVAPYFGGNHWFLRQEGLTPDSFFAPWSVKDDQGKVYQGSNYLLDESYSTIGEGVKANKAICDSLGVQLHVYEGGLDLESYADRPDDSVGRRQSNEAKRAVQADPRLKAVVMNYLNGWFNVTKGGLFCWFVAADSWRKWAWGAVPHPSKQGGPKLEAIREKLASFPIDIGIKWFSFNPTTGLRAPFSRFTKGETIEVEFDKNVSRVDFKLDGAVIGVERLAPFRAQGDTTPMTVGDGEHTLVVIAYDPDGKPYPEKKLVFSVGETEIEKLRRENAELASKIEGLRKSMEEVTASLKTLEEQLKASKAEVKTINEYLTRVQNWKESFPSA